jgi:type II restriction enzyme
LKGGAMIKSAPMNLALPSELAQRYKSPSQQARIVTQTWARDNLFCANCSALKLTPTREGTEVNDLSCPRCGQRYELKSKSAPIISKIMDAGFDAMMRAIRSDRTPNLVLLHYEKPLWTIRNLFLVPHFAFAESAIERRNALSDTAERHGHVLCNIVLSNIPSEAKIPLVSEGTISPPAKVREHYRRLEPLKEIRVKQRGWALDILNIVQKLNKPEFSNEDVYAFEDELKLLHPDNNRIPQKIRQKLQVLRDLGLLHHLGRGKWRLKLG